MLAAATNGAKACGVKAFGELLFRFLPENISDGSVDPFDAAIGYAYGGDADKTLIWLQRAIEARSFGITYLDVNPVFDEVRADERFISLLRRMGLPFARSPLSSS